MTLQLLHSEFPYIWGKFYFLFLSVWYVSSCSVYNASPPQRYSSCTECILLYANVLIYVRRQEDLISPEYLLSSSNQLVWTCPSIIIITTWRLLPVPAARWQVSRVFLQLISNRLLDAGQEGCVGHRALTLPLSPPPPHPYPAPLPPSLSPLPPPRPECASNTLCIEK